MNEQEYIMLREGDLVEVGDEVQLTDGSWSDQIWIVGQQWDSRIHLPIRRTIEVKIEDLY